MKVFDMFNGEFVDFPDFDKDIDPRFLVRFANAKANNRISEMVRYYCNRTLKGCSQPFRW